LRGDIVGRKSESERVGVVKQVVFCGEIAAVLVKLSVYSGFVLFDVDDGALEAEWGVWGVGFVADKPIPEIHRSGEIGGCHGHERGDEECSKHTGGYDWSRRKYNGSEIARQERLPTHKAYKPRDSTSRIRAPAPFGSYDLAIIRPSIILLAK
jgi:hypothetical protein